MKPRVLIVDDHTLVRNGLRQLLAENFEIKEFGEAGTSAEAIAAAQASKWDIVLLDISLPGQSGLDVLKQFRELQPSAKVLILTMHPESHYAVRVLKAGAAGYITKESAGKETVEAVKKVMAGGKYISPGLAEHLASNIGATDAQSPHESLSDREYQVMQMLATGKTVKEISFELGLSIKTVSTYRTRLMSKLNFKTNADLVRYVLNEKLIR